MAENNASRDALPEQFSSIEAAADFWDSHDLTEYEDQTTESEIRVDLVRRRRLFAVDPELAAKISDEASRRGLSAETLVNLWLNERLTPGTT
jgi:hypothetical protein